MAYIYAKIDAMLQTPLDTPMDFAPAADERPAGRWMEGYWARMVPWAKSFSIAIAVYWLLNLYGHIQRLLLYYEGWNANSLGRLLSFLLLYAPAAFLGYFCFRFGQDLEKALRLGDQWLLERAFRHLHRFLITGVLLVVFWAFIAAMQWYNSLLILDNPAYLPLQTEEN